MLRMGTLSILDDANNPCALRPHPGEGWLGNNGVIRLPGGEYQSFTAMRWGLRAALRNLHTYRTRHGLRTPAQIVGRWAPPADDNPTGAYAANVARWIGVGVDEPIPHDYRHIRALLLAIARQETGGRYRPRPADIAAAFRLMAEEERARGRDPSPYVPPVVEAPIERATQEARRVPRRWWAGIGAAITGALAWAQDLLWQVGVMPAQALAWLREHAAGAPWLALALIGAALLLIWIAWPRKRPPKEKADDESDLPDAPTGAGPEDRGRRGDDRGGPGGGRLGVKRRADHGRDRSAGDLRRLVRRFGGGS